MTTSGWAVPTGPPWISRFHLQIHSTVESSSWRIGGGGRWLLSTPNSRRGLIDETDYSNAEPLELVDLRDGRNLSLVVGAEDSFTEFRTAALSSDGNWLATSTDTELVVVNLVTGSAVPQ